MSFPDDRWIALFGPTLCGVTKGCIPTPCVCAYNLNPAFREVQCGFRAHADILGIPFEQVMANGLARVPIKRFLKPDEIGHLAVYLGSTESDGMTGQSILLDGGMLVV